MMTPRTALPRHLGVGLTKSFFGLVRACAFLTIVLACPSPYSIQAEEPGGGDWDVYDPLDDFEMPPDDECDFRPVDDKKPVKYPLRRLPTRPKPGEFCFRGTAMEPNGFENGLFSFCQNPEKGHMNVEWHTTRKDFYRSCFISLSKCQKVAERYAGAWSFVYRIPTSRCGDFIDINQAFPATLYGEDQEVLAKLRIPACDIEGRYVYEDGQCMGFQKNPNFRPDPLSQQICQLRPGRLIGSGFASGVATGAVNSSGLVDPTVANCAMLGGNAAYAYGCSGAGGLVGLGTGMAGGIGGSTVAWACGAGQDTQELCGAYGSLAAGFVGGPAAGVANGIGMVGGYAGELCWGLASGFWNYGSEFGSALIGGSTYSPPPPEIRVPGAAPFQPSID